MGLLARYRATGADLPFGDPLSRHGVAMEGYFWRFTDLRKGRVLIALIGVNKAADGSWALVGLGAHPGGFFRAATPETATARKRGVGARAENVFQGDDWRVRADLGPDANLDVTLSSLQPWPRRRFGGSSLFQMVPGLNQYWHPWLLGGRADGVATIGDETWHLNGTQVYAEKNWGRGGFPDSWWWGQSQGFDEEEACVAFAGGQVKTRRFRGEVTGLVVRLPEGELIRLGNPVVSPVKARIGDTTWELRGRARGWRIEVHGRAPLDQAHILPVPLVRERRAVPGAVEHLAGTLSISVRHRRKLIWEDSSGLAGLEHGGLDRAAAELRRRETSG